MQDSYWHLLQRSLVLDAWRGPLHPALSRLIAMENAARLEAMLQGLAHRQQAGMSMHGGLFSLLFWISLAPQYQLKCFCMMPAAMRSQVFTESKEDRI